MKITNITPPSERIFTLELTENELKYLGLIVANTNFVTIENLIEKKSWKINQFPGIKSDEKCSMRFYSMVVDTFKS
jgi:hypothetical protein